MPEVASLPGPKDFPGVWGRLLGMGKMCDPSAALDDRAVDPVLLQDESGVKRCFAVSVAIKASFGTTSADGEAKRRRLDSSELDARERCQHRDPASLAEQTPVPLFSQLPCDAPTCCVASAEDGPCSSPRSAAEGTELMDAAAAAAAAAAGGQAGAGQRPLLLQHSTSSVLPGEDANSSEVVIAAAAAALDGMEVVPVVKAEAVCDADGALTEPPSLSEDEMAVDESPRSDRACPLDEVSAAAAAAPAPVGSSSSALASAVVEKLETLATVVKPESNSAVPCDSAPCAAGGESCATAAAEEAALAMAPVSDGAGVLKQEEGRAFPLPAAATPVLALVAAPAPAAAAAVVQRSNSSAAVAARLAAAQARLAAVDKQLRLALETEKCRYQQEEGRDPPSGSELVVSTPKLSLKIRIPRAALESAAAALAAAASSQRARKGKKEVWREGLPSPDLSCLFGRPVVPSELRNLDNAEWRRRQVVLSGCGGNKGGSSGLFLSALTACSPEKLAMHVVALRMDFLARNLRVLLNKFMKHTSNRNDIFNTPVDPVALSLPTYQQIVRNPMDLGTIKGRLQDLKYDTHEAFAEDVRLTFNNAMVFNPPAHNVHLMAKTLLSEFEGEYSKLVQRMERDTARRNEHDCSLCQGQTCMLCGDKCQRLEPPVLICHGPCNSRIRRDSYFHVTKDGSRLWCAKCFPSLPVVLEIDEDDEAIAASPATRAIILTANRKSAAAARQLSGGGGAAVASRAARGANGICGAARRLSVTGRTSSSGAAAAPLAAAALSQLHRPADARALVAARRNDENASPVPALSRPVIQKKDLLKRRLDEDINEPWVQCDHCHGWVHQICGGFNARANFDGCDESSKFVCPLCRLRELLPPQPPPPAKLAAAGGGGGKKSRAAERKEKALQQQQQQPPPAPVVPLPLVPLPLQPLPVAMQAAAVASNASDSASARSSAGAASFAPLSSSSSSSQSDRRAGSDVAVSKTAQAAKGGVSEARETGLRGNDDNGAPQPMAIDEEAGVGSSSGGGNVDEQETLAQEAATAAAAAAASRAMEEARLREAASVYSAAALPHTAVSRYIEGRVRRLLHELKEPGVAGTVHIRCVSNATNSFEVSPVIRKAFQGGPPPKDAARDETAAAGSGCDDRSSNNGSPAPPPTATPVPEQVQYNSKALMMFQTIDGADVCLFSVYVQEHGKNSPPCNAGRVYVAYLDSVEYFRPRSVRTAVYHELLVAYLDYVRRRGFHTAHIWSCPPQRGNNFIFWCHPLHQRTPTRERLVDWYNGMLRRAEGLGIVKQVDNMQTSHFQEVARVMHLHRTGTLDASTLPAVPPLFEGEFWMDEVVRLFKTVERKSDADFVTEHLSPMDLCRAALDDLMQETKAQPFLRPVDPVADRCPDYFTAIPHPMDLGTVSQKLDSNAYATAAAFVEDVKLVFSNAIKYNPAKHSVHLAAKCLAAAFAKAVARVQKCTRDRLNRPVGLEDILLSEEIEEVGMAVCDGASSVCETGNCGPFCTSRTDANGTFSAGALGTASAGCKISNSSNELLEPLATTATLTTGATAGESAGSALAAAGAVSTATDASGSGGGGLAGSVPPPPPRLRRASRSMGSNASFAGFYGADAAALRRCDSFIALGGNGSGSVVNGDGGGRGSFNLGPMTPRGTRVMRINSNCSDALSCASNSNDLSAEQALEQAICAQGLGSAGAAAAMAMQQDCSSDNTAAAAYAAAVSAAAAAAADSGVSPMVVDGDAATPAAAAAAAAASAGVPVIRRRSSVGFDSVAGTMDETASSSGSSASRSRVAGRGGGGSSGGSGGGGGASAQANSNAQTAQQIAGNKVRWVLSQLCKAVDRMKRDLLVVTLAAPDARVNPAWDGGFTEGLGGINNDNNVLQQWKLAPDLSDPDPRMSLPLVDSRHTFLEMCQLRHYQYDTLRRAKHSSAMVLYHLHRPECRSLNPFCSNCREPIRGVRWHCSACTDYDLCAACEPRWRTLHKGDDHPLTPFRVTFSTGDADVSAVRSAAAAAAAPAAGATAFAAAAAAAAPTASAAAAAAPTASAAAGAAAAAAGAPAAAAAAAAVPAAAAAAAAAAWKPVAEGMTAAAVVSCEGAPLSEVPVMAAAEAGNNEQSLFGKPAVQEGMQVDGEPVPLQQQQQQQQSSIVLGALAKDSGFSDAGAVMDVE